MIVCPRGGACEHCEGEPFNQDADSWGADPEDIKKARAKSLEEGGVKKKRSAPKKTKEDKPKKKKQKKADSDSEDEGRAEEEEEEVPEEKKKTAKSSRKKKDQVIILDDAEENSLRKKCTKCGKKITVVRAGHNNSLADPVCLPCYDAMVFKKPTSPPSKRPSIPPTVTGPWAEKNISVQDPMASPLPPPIEKHSSPTSPSAKEPLYIDPEAFGWFDQMFDAGTVLVPEILQAQEDLTQDDEELKFCPGCSKEVSLDKFNSQFERCNLCMDVKNTYDEQKKRESEDRLREIEELEKKKNLIRAAEERIRLLEEDKKNIDEKKKEEEREGLRLAIEIQEKKKKLIKETEERLALLEEQKKKIEEEERLELEAEEKKKEENRLALEAEEKRKEEESLRLVEEQKKNEEEARLALEAEEKRKEEERLKSISEYEERLRFSIDEEKERQRLLEAAIERQRLEEKEKKTSEEQTPQEEPTLNKKKIRKRKEVEEVDQSLLNEGRKTRSRNTKS